MKKKVLLTLGVTCMLAGTPLAFANNNNNHKDTKWSCNLPRFQGNYYTGPRQKRDKSSSYLKCRFAGKGGVRGWVQMAWGKECNSPKRVAYPGKSVKLKNYAYEWYGKSNVRLALESSYSNPVKVKAYGVWSPDSI